MPIAIAVADPHPQDYVDLLRNFAEEADCLTFVSSVRAALTVHFAHAWIVHTNLPEMSGFEFCEALVSRFPPSRILMVDDVYQVENELRARSGGAMYACKPILAASLVGWCQALCMEKGGSEIGAAGRSSNPAPSAQGGTPYPTWERNAR